MEKLYYYFNISNINMEGKPISEDDYNDYIFCPVNKGVCSIDLKNKFSDIIHYDKSEYQYPSYYIKPHFNLSIEGERITPRGMWDGVPVNGYYTRNLIKFIDKHPNEFKEIKLEDLDKLKLAEKLVR